MSDTATAEGVEIAVKVQRGDDWPERLITTCPGCFAQTMVPPECLPLTKEEHEALTGPCGLERRGEACALWQERAA